MNFFFSVVKNQSGSALMIISGVVLVLSTVVVGALWSFDVGLETFRSINEQKQAFYMSEGMRNVTTVLLENYLQDHPMPTGDDISTFLNGKLAPLVSGSYAVSPVTVQVLKNTPNSTLTSGPFAGMNAPIIELSTKFSVSLPSKVFNGNVTIPMTSQISVGYISMFQFMIFYDMPKASLQTGPDLYIKGRLHANGDLCIGSNSGYTYILKATVGKRLMAYNDSRCGNGGTSNTRIATDGTFTTFADLKSNYDNGCSNCAGSGLGWQAFALARWRKQALDQAHGVQVLKLPGSGIGIVQGRQAGNWADTNNSGNLRFIIDPVVPTDTTAVKSYKFANNADIRIINGVWYLRDPGNSNTWPGIPIWSDHPGRYTENSVGVGQDDIRDLWAATYPWPAAPDVPRKYSYYAYDYSNQTLFTPTAGGGVISYGNLFSTGTLPSRWIPGNWVGKTPSTFCVGGGNLTCTGGCRLMNPWSATPITCPGAADPGRDPGIVSQVLNGTRGGFRNGHIYQISPGTAAQRSNRAHQLPVNFDVNQLQVALQDTSPGELGSYFGAGRFMDAEFNGIVYITSVWPGALSGFNGGSPAEFPTQGSVGDATQIGITHDAVQRALPQPLCSNNVSLGVPANAYATSGFDAVGPAMASTIRFKVPDCAQYLAGQPIQAYPNVVRLINGTNFDGAVLTKGLSIITNLPLYMMGDYNTNSTQTSASSTPWVSSLIGGDKVIYLSNSWSDSNSPWDQAPTLTRNATSTTYNTAILTEPSETLSSLLEDWTGRTLTNNGSMVIGYNSVYALHQNYCCGNVTYQPPNRVFNFDPHFGFISNQPPGTPVFPVSATLLWTNSN